MCNVPQKIQPRIPTGTDPSQAGVSDDGPAVIQQRCHRCGKRGCTIDCRTVLLMLKPDLLEQAITGTYSFCTARQCPVVYFEETGNHSLTIDDLRVRVGVKES